MKNEDLLDYDIAGYGLEFYGQGLAVAHFVVGAGGSVQRPLAARIEAIRAN